MKTKISILLAALIAVSFTEIRTICAQNYDVAVSDEIVGEKNNSSKKTDAGADFNFASRYLWRGIYFTEGFVWQPSAWISKWGLTPSVWANYILNNEQRQWKFSEVDLGLTYENKIGELKVKPGFLYFLYPYDFELSTSELSLFLSYPIGPIDLFTTQNVDVKEYRGAYYGDFGVNFAKNLSEQISIEASGKIAWGSSRFNNAYYGIPVNAVNNFSLRTSMISNIFKYLYVAPYLQYTVLIDNDLRNGSGQPNLYCVGVSIGATY